MIIALKPMPAWRRIPSAQFPPDADVYDAETGRFLRVRKAFRVNLQTGNVTVLSMKANS